MRKLEKQTKSVDDVEITEMKNKYGSNYGKRSAIKNQSKTFGSHEMLEFDDIKNIVESEGVNDAYDIETLINGIEKQIVGWLQIKNLPVEDFKNTEQERYSFKSLSQVLKDDYPDIKGALEAASCLHELNCCREYFLREDYEASLKNSLRLTMAFQLFYFSINESKISLGNYRNEALIGSNTRLTTEQYEQAFEYFEKTTCNDTRRLNKGERWEKVSEYVREQLNRNIKAETLGKAYRERKKL
ncbi:MULTISPECIES: hypothetical protein [unclassified Pseudoalteromonas]|uniref:hypothetical protein n=1 Tax=unclassified Pseudoalteromonas TaxID=194690 RepID=UPI00235940B5|nr:MULTISPECIES: hypothetical protein [unclassified Pseudoalteromonas]MDC9564840.1 hypothetical protein [Pseudoalteromonas sp. GAB2316C]MDC9569288.1 hypothetical protein [Pseudoalteromonas sp. GABNB9D]MDC9573386.1 hypothetical protein [Pseudoalteromonas sp. GABNS16A]MDC9577645.1 hypothetical protein [Pseudoalteromonas sp. GABNS16E]MDC9585298.1 hypothetical protein [Pseudoalteromonas sp. GABNS16C]